VSYLIDTNIISELRKGAKCDPGVAAWWATVAEEDLWLSALVLGEIRKGVELARRRDPAKAEALEGWLAEVVANFGDRVLTVDAAVADAWGRMGAIRSAPVIDSLLAATSKANALTLVTRNAAAVAGLGIEVLNPFQGN
jgi:predicted nucleic acid-binding protein